MFGYCPLTEADGWFIGQFPDGSITRHGGIRKVSLLKVDDGTFEGRLLWDDRLDGLPIEGRAFRSLSES